MGIFDTVIKKVAVLAISLGLIFVLVLLSYTLFICPFIDCRLPAHPQCEQKISK